MGTILVTGGGGFLGRELIRQLLKQGESVRSFARGDYPELHALGVDVRRGDLQDLEAVRAAVSGCEAVFHAAAKPPPWGRRSEYEAANVEGTRNVIEACVAAGCSYLVYTSTPSVVGGAEDIEGGDESLPYREDFSGAEYPRSKALAERALLAADGQGGLRTLAIRPHLIWGPGDPHFLPRFVAKAQAGQLRRIGRRDAEVDPTFISDAAAAHLCALQRLRAGAEVSGRAYFVSGDERIGLWTMVDRMLGTAGLPALERSVPAALAAFLAYIIEGVHRLFSLPGEPRITRFVVQQVTHARWFDVSAARRDLGYEPKVTIDEGMRRLSEEQVD